MSDSTSSIFYNQPNRVLQPGQRGYGSTAPQMPKLSWWDYIFKAGRDQKMAKYQNDYNYWLWQEQNRYNTPSAQMNRYKDAGLNPNLMYEQGGPGNADSPQPGVAPGMPPGGPFQLLDKYMDLKMKTAQVNQVEANTRLTDAQAYTERGLPGLNEAKRVLSTQQYHDLVADMQAKDINWSDIQRIAKGGAVSADGGRAVGMAAKYSEEMNRAARSKIDAEISQETLKWLGSNNLSRWIPLISSLLRMAN